MKPILTHLKKPSHSLSIIGVRGHLIPSRQKDQIVNTKARNLSRETSSRYFLSFQGQKATRFKTHKGICNKRIKPYINTSNYIKRIAFQLRRMPNIKIVKKLTTQSRSNSFRKKHNDLSKVVTGTTNDVYNEVSTLMSIVSLPLEQPVKKNLGISGGVSYSRPRTALRSERGNQFQYKSQSRGSSRQLINSLGEDRSFSDYLKTPKRFICLLSNRIWENNGLKEGNREFRISIKPKQAKLDCTYGYTDMVNL